MLRNHILDSSIPREVLEVDLKEHPKHIELYNSEISNKLKILSLSTSDSYSFLYCLSNSVLIDHQPCNSRDQIHIDLGLLANFLASKSIKTHIINSTDDVGVSFGYKCVCKKIYFEGNFVAITGFILPENRASKRRRNSYVANKLSPQQNKIIQLIFEDINNFICDKQLKIAQSIIHSQHIQLSSLNQDLIAIKDEAHKVIYANPAYINSFPSTERTSLLGKRNDHLFDKKSRSSILESDLFALRNSIYIGTQNLTLANGEDKVLQTTKKSFVGIDNKKYIMCVSRDITEKEALINNLKRSNADLDNFAYVASHDLKAPLNAIKRLVSWVSEDCASILPKESLEDLRIVLSRTNRMEQLLNDLLSYSRIGKDYQEASEINLKKFVIELLSLIDLPMGFVLNCDDVKISVPLIPFKVLMLNLVSNAIKHHDSGNAKIEIKARANTKGCSITVMDNGPGIDEKNRERVFKLFETLKPRDEVEGSGIGLSVVKKIIEFYGGSIKVEANYPRGAKFIFKWPRKSMVRSVLNSLNEN